MPSIVNATTTAGVSVQGDNSGVLALQTNNGTTAVTIDTSQNVGIGTASPAARLDVRTTSSTQATFTRTGQTAVCTLYQSSADTYLSATNSGANLILATQDTERMRIDSSGNVGIGITPDTKFEVSGTGAVMRVSTNHSTSGTLDLSADATAAQIKVSWYNSAVPLVFKSGNTEQMRLNSSGTLFIGATSSPNGTQRLVLTADGNAGTEPLLINELRAGNSSENAIRFYRNGSQVGTITTNASNTSYNTSSDYRLKENIAPMTGALAKVQQLKPCTYTWKVDGSVGQGFIAHELAEVVPQAVTGEKDAVDKDGKIKPQGIDTSFLVATLTAAIQELKAELDATKAEVQALKGVA